MKEFKCEKCGNEFDSENAREQHASAVHGKENAAKKFASGKAAKYAIAILIVAALGFGLFYLAASVPSDKYSGKAAANFALKSTDGKVVSLSDFSGKKNVLLFFSEGLGCDSCWQQLADMQKKSKDFQGMNTEILTIVVNPPVPSAEEARRWGITLPVLTDENLEVSASYGALKYSMHPGQLPGHTFILIDKNGFIRWRWDWRNGSMYFPVDALLLEVKNFSGN